MGVAGATAAEAENTISGSINSLQAALQNLLVGFGNADADMEMLCQNMVDALQNVIRNVPPVIENMVKVLPTVTDALLTAFADLLPSLLDTVTQLFTQLLNTILTLLPQLIPAAVEAIMTIVQALIDSLPLPVDAAVQLVVALVEGIGTALAGKYRPIWYNRFGFIQAVSTSLFLTPTLPYFAIPMSTLLSGSPRSSRAWRTRSVPYTASIPLTANTGSSTSLSWYSSLARQAKQGIDSAVPAGTG